MKVAIIGRTSILYNCAKILLDNHFEIPLIITSKEAPEYTINSNDFKKLAEDIGAKFIYTPKINEEEIITNILSLGEIDLAVSINYSGVISQKVINLFRFGVLNAQEETLTTKGVPFFGRHRLALPPCSRIYLLL